VGLADAKGELKVEVKTTGGFGPLFLFKELFMCCEHELVDIQSAKWCLMCGTAFEDKILEDCTENKGKHNLVDIKKAQWCAKCGAIFIGDLLINNI
jgi:hypothetical protein